MIHPVKVNCAQHPSNLNRLGVAAEPLQRGGTAQIHNFAQLIKSGVQS